SWFSWLSWRRIRQPSIECSLIDALHESHTRGTLAVHLEVLCVEHDAVRKWSSKTKIWIGLIGWQSTGSFGPALHNCGCSHCHLFVKRVARPAKGIAAREMRCLAVDGRAPCAAILAMSAFIADGAGNSQFSLTSSPFKNSYAPF